MRRVAPGSCPGSRPAAAPRLRGRGDELGALGAKLGQMGGVVEEFVEGAEKRSPSAQYRVDPTARSSGSRPTTRSSADRPGRSSSVASFRPTPPTGSRSRTRAWRRRTACGSGRTRPLRDRLHLSPRRPWLGPPAIEVNLRKGGTTHPFQMLQFLTDGTYIPKPAPSPRRPGRPCAILPPTTSSRTATAA